LKIWKKPVSLEKTELEQTPYKKLIMLKKQDEKKSVKKSVLKVENFLKKKLKINTETDIAPKHRKTNKTTDYERC
jgi:hypothetical protein